MMELFCIMILVVVSQVHTYVKTHRVYAPKGDITIY